MKRTVMMTGALLFGASALAHTHLESSVPADNSKVAAPKTIELRFSEAVRVTSLTLQQGAAAAKALAMPTKKAAVVAVPVPGLTNGDYKVTWRVAGEDGHVMSGSFGFTVDPAAPVAGSSVKAPAASGDEHKH